MIQRHRRFVRNSIHHFSDHSYRIVIVTLSIVFSALNVSDASNFNFRIQDYKPDTVIAKQWELKGGWSAQGVRGNKLRALSYWDMPYEERGNTISRDSLLISLNSTWRNIRLLRSKEYTASYSIKYEYENLKGVIDSTFCRNCVSEGSLRTSVYDPIAYRNNLSLSSDFYFWKMVRRPIGVFASVGGTVLGEEDWGVGFIATNSYSADSTYHRWIHGENRSNSRRSRYGGTITTRGGLTFGQQYEGKYASAVLYILEELEKSGRLDHSPTFDDIHLLCDTALCYVNAYATDDRRHRVSLLTALTSALDQLHLLKGPSTETTFFIDDIWYNMTYSTRPYGFQVRVAQQAAVGGEAYRSSSRNWRYSREVITPLDSPYVTRVYEVTSLNVNSNRGWSGTGSVVLNTSINALFGLPLSSRWQWNTILVAASGDITNDWSWSSVHTLIDRWWDNASVSLQSNLEYHATPRTAYTATLAAEARRLRPPSRNSYFGIEDGVGRLHSIQSQILCRHWAVEKVALDMRLFFNANHSSVQVPSQKSTHWFRDYGIAIGVSVRGGY